MNNNIILSFIMLVLFNLAMAVVGGVYNDSSEEIQQKRIALEVENAQLITASLQEDKFIEGKLRDQAQDLLPPIDTNPGLYEFGDLLKQGMRVQIEDTAGENKIEKQLINIYKWIFGIGNFTLTMWFLIAIYTRDIKK